VTENIDTLILPGGADAPTASKDRTLIEWTGRFADRAARVASVCTGAFLAAQAGLLTERRAVTHWRYCDEFKQRFPDVRLDFDPIWINEGRIWSSAGVSAGVDLTLALIEEDHGVELALQTARELVVFLKRPGGQSQFSTLLSGQIADAGGPIEKLLAWIADNLGSDLRPEVLAESVNMSLRTFARNCMAHTGRTPSKLIETLRVQAAREAIEKSDTSFEAIATRYGFGDEQRMRRAFIRQLRATPADLRLRFGR
jgi:transcriptional regulator GlxA family with amidase domain